MKQTFGSQISPKSIVHDGRGLFSAQNMMYKHSVTLYNSNGVLLKSIPDAVNLRAFGFDEYEDVIYQGAPVEACFTPDGKYLWVSNYAMYGPGFTNEGCDACSGDDYDPSFLYKINTLNYRIESVVKVGSVPKYLTVSQNGKLLLVSNWTSSDVSIIDLESEKEIRRVKVGLRPRGIVVDKRNQKAYVALMGSHKIGVINLLNFSVNYINDIGKAPRHLILNQDNTALFVAVNSANKVAKVDLRTKKVTYCEAKPGPRSMILSADEKYLYVVNYYASAFQKIDAKSMTLIETVSTLQKPIGIAGDWKNGNIWVSCYSGKIQIYNDPELQIITKTITEENQAHVGKIKLAGLLLSMADIPAKIERDQSVNHEALKEDLDATRRYHHFNANLKQVLVARDSACQYSVIVGSFSVVKNAYHMQTLLRTQDLSSFLLPSTNGSLTMVGVGVFDSRQMAMRQVKKLKTKHAISAWIHQKYCSQ